MTLAVNDVGGQTLGGAMLDKYIFGADVSSYFLHLCLKSKTSLVTDSFTCL